MNRFFYHKLALNNIKKNSKAYIPYILTSIGTIAMFYTMSFLNSAKDIGSMSDSATLRSILWMGSAVIAIFSLIFLFYTNSFLIKKRKKEFGLFNILGMEKKHIGKIMFYETVFTSLISLTAGLLSGILLSKLMILLLFKLISFKVTFGFEVPIRSVGITICLFSAIFMINLVYNVLQVHVSNPIELLRSGNAGEKEPKTKHIITIIGAVCLGTGYYIAITTKSPLEALTLFFTAVVLVIIGTYCLFTSGSIAFLKTLRKNKSYYYKPNHFISVSGMIYRMKQNAAGLASICILSTAVIIMISTTISLYAGMEDVLRSRYPRNIIVTAADITDAEAEKIDELIEKQTRESDISQENIIHFRNMNFGVIQDGSTFTTNPMWDSNQVSNMATLIFITQDDYNRLNNEDVSLSENEALLYESNGSIPEDILNFNGFKLSIKKHINSLNLPSENLTKSYYVVAKDKSTIDNVYTSLTGEKQAKELSYYYGFDANTDSQSKIDLVYNMSINIGDFETAEGIYIECVENSRSSFYSIYGSLLFLGIFLGLLFIMATVLIIYYKQIAEGYDDKKRFEIMQNVGMSLTEIKKAVKSQVLTVFFIPLLSAVIHITVAFNVITKLLAALNLTNVLLFAQCTAITIFIFAVLYTVVYAMTAKVYYKIVS